MSREGRVIIHEPLAGESGVRPFERGAVDSLDRSAVEIDPPRF
jgi:hypothetical protein